MAKSIVPCHSWHPWAVQLRREHPESLEVWRVGLVIGLKVRHYNITNPGGFDSSSRKSHVYNHGAAIKLSLIFEGRVFMWFVKHYQDCDMTLWYGPVPLNCKHFSIVRCEIAQKKAESKHQMLRQLKNFSLTLHSSKLIICNYWHRICDCVNILNCILNDSESSMVLGVKGVLRTTKDSSQ